MELRDYGRTLRKRWRLVTLCVLLSLAAAVGVTLAATPVYQARAQLFVSSQGGDTVTQAYQGGLFTQQRVKSYASVITSPVVLDGVIADLGLDATSGELARNITAQAPPDTVLLNVTYRDSSPAKAQQTVNALAKRFTAFVNQLEAPVAGGPSPVKVAVVRESGLPRQPVAPRTKVNLALGVLVGLAVGVGASLLRETTDTSVKGNSDLASLTGVATLGIITFDAEAAKRPLVVQSDPHGTRAEAFRQLRTNLQFVDIDHKPQSIVVTSSLPGEGKSTTTANLAITLAQAGLRVVLIDADLRRPRLAEYLGLEGAVGLTDVLVGRRELAEVLQPWGADGMMLLASGPTPPNPSELLGSHGMSDLLRHLERETDLVLIDTPPLLPVTDAAVLSTIVSGTLLVARAGSTRREQINQAMGSLQNVGAKVLGTILNMAPTKGPDAYRYGYGYGYGYGPTPPADTPEPSSAAAEPEPPRASAPAHAASTAPIVSSDQPAQAAAGSAAGSRGVAAPVVTSEDLALRSE